MKKTVNLILWIAIITLSSIGLSTLFPNDLGSFVYYTNLSNLLVLIFFIYLLYRQFVQKLPFNPILVQLKGGVTICITLTFLVYAILLAPFAKPEDFYTVGNYTKHYLVPILVLIDWFFFDPRGQYLLFDPIKWTRLPLAYCLFALIRGYVFRIPIANEPHSPYPYFFLNIDRYGWSGFAVYFTRLLTAYLIFGYLMLFIKRKKLE